MAFGPDLHSTHGARKQAADLAGPTNVDPFASTFVGSLRFVPYQSEDSWTDGADLNERIETYGGD